MDRKPKLECNSHEGTSIESRKQRAREDKSNVSFDVFLFASLLAVLCHNLQYLTVIVSVSNHKANNDYSPTTYQQLYLLVETIMLRLKKAVLHHSPIASKPRNACIDLDNFTVR